MIPGPTTPHTVIIGDARCMDELPDRSVHLVVTSPPYWQLKDYERSGQIGFHDSYEDYINNLNLVWAECRRVLHDGCRLCINIGDQFARAACYGRYKVIPIRTEIIRFCETIGLDYMGAIIWRKVTTCNTTGGASVMGSFPHPRNGILKLDYEFILLFKKPGTPPAVSRDLKERSAMSTEEWNTFFQGHWTFPGAKQSQHPAAFPLELPRRLLRMFSFVGETVLDPFLGSGTTSLAAQELSRRSIGYEINEQYEPVIRQRFEAHSTPIFGEPPIAVHRRGGTGAHDPDTLLESLPYRFRDPVHISPSHKSRLGSFGSKVTPGTPSREEYRRVKHVISPCLVELDDGRRIRLLGVRPVPSRITQATAYLVQLAQKKKVYLRFDDPRGDDENNLLCYLYLANRTFINARLIKSGLVEVDDTFPFSKKELFQRYYQRQHREQTA